jgi:putative cell wall-binding protein
VPPIEALVTTRGSRIRAVLAVVGLAATVATVAPARAAETDTEEADETITTTVDAGETARTDGSSTTPTLVNPIVASLVSSVDGDVSFTKLSTVPEVAGYRTFGAITIEAPTATATSPHRLSLSFDITDVPTGEAIESIVLLRDGTPVPTCEATSVATPDPCFVSRTVSGDAVTMVALTSAASTWTAAWRELERVAPTTTTVTGAGAISIAASRRLFAPQSVSAVVLARVDDFADALAGAPLAAERNAPLLLTSSDALDDETLDEITRVLAPGELVYVLGGEAAIGAAVVERLESWGFLVQRYAGADRYATAVAINADEFTSASTVYLATGTGFADALAGAALAGSQGAPLFVSQPTCIPQAVADAIESLGATSVVLLGGTGVLTAAVENGTLCH